MIVAHIIMAIFATMRLTEVITQDRISQRFRQRFPTYLWTCPRCVSVWAGIVATLAFHFAPFANWPLALSMLFTIASMLTGRLNYALQRKIIVLPEQQRIEWGDYAPEKALVILREIVSSLETQKRVAVSRG